VITSPARLKARDHEPTQAKPGRAGPNDQSSRAPIHSTPVPPPEPSQRQVPVQRAQPREGAREQPAQPTRDVTPRGAEARGSNVHRLHPEPPTDRDAPSAPRDVQPPPQRQYDQVCAYGGDVALQFERCPSKDRSTNTINLKCARAKPGGKTRQGCDWHNAILLMLTPHEVQLVVAVLMGYLGKFRAAGHGATNDKWFEVEETSEAYAGAVRFTVAQGKGSDRDIRRVNVGATDVGEVVAVFLRAAQDQLRLPGPLLLQAIRRTAQLYQLSQEASATRRAS